MIFLLLSRSFLLLSVQRHALFFEVLFLEEKLKQVHLSLVGYKFLTALLFSKHILAIGSLTFKAQRSAPFCLINSQTIFVAGTSARIEAIQVGYQFLSF